MRLGLVRSRRSGGRNVAIIFPISVEEETNKFRITLSESVFEYIQFLFFVYPESMVQKSTKEFRNNHLLEFEGQIKLTLRELDVFCRDVLRWKNEMDVWQGDRLDDPFSREFDPSLHKTLENDVSLILKVIKAELVDNLSTSFRSNG